MAHMTPMHKITDCILHFDGRVEKYRYELRESIGPCSADMNLQAVGMATIEA